MDHKPTHLVSFIRKRNRKKFYVAGVKDENYFKKVIGMAFKGRFRKPDALRVNDGVRIIVSRVTDGMIVMKRMVYNKSTLQTMTELERIIEATPA